MLHQFLSAPTVETRGGEIFENVALFAALLAALGIRLPIGFQRHIPAAQQTPPQQHLADEYNFLQAAAMSHNPISDVQNRHALYEDIVKMLTPSQGKKLREIVGHVAGNNADGTGGYKIYTFLTDLCSEFGTHAAHDFLVNSGVLANATDAIAETAKNGIEEFAELSVVISQMLRLIPAAKGSLSERFFSILQAARDSDIITTLRAYKASQNGFAERRAFISSIDKAIISIKSKGHAPKSSNAHLAMPPLRVLVVIVLMLLFILCILIFGISLHK